jgi:hypothetical protein
MAKRITQNPFPGDSGVTPTGAMQFQNDWPGLFIRGDAAFDLHMKIRTLQQRLAGNQDAAVTLSLMVLGDLADIIEQDVIVRSSDV